MTAADDGSVPEMRAALTALEIPETFAQVVPADAREIPGGQTPDRWYVTPIVVDARTSGWTIGAFDRGSFAPYDTYETLDLAVNAVRHLLAAPVEPRTIDPTRAQQALDRARGLETFVRARQPVSGADIPPGTAFDTYGTLANHTVFAWRTPVPARSNPPTDLGRPYLQVITRRALPDPIRAGVMAPAFEQPGGGVALSLPRCLRWYFDAGVLDLFTVEGGR